MAAILKRYAYMTKNQEGIIKGRRNHPKVSTFAPSAWKVLGTIYKPAGEITDEYISSSMFSWNLQNKVIKQLYHKKHINNISNKLLNNSNIIIKLMSI